jgi:hypothetical protein
MSILSGLTPLYGTALMTGTYPFFFLISSYELVMKRDSDIEIRCANRFAQQVAL